MADLKVFDSLGQCVYESPGPYDVVEFMEQLQEIIGYVRWMKDKFPTLPLEELEAAYKKVSSSCIFFAME